MKKNYTKFHVHSTLSNGTTTLDSVNKFQDYVDRAKECDMTAFGFSEHGNIFEWLHKKEYIEKNGMKYIHGVEMYVTEDLNEKQRDNYHVGLYAKNFEGFKELNKLTSHNVAFNRENDHFYYSPRITFDELIQTSDNIIITTACLGGILYSGNENIKERFIKFLSENSHRCFLEIQHHNVKEQIEYNEYLCELSSKISVPLIAGTDTHALNEEYMVGRQILQARKNIHFDNEDEWDLTFKSYEELVECFKKQNSLSEKTYLQAIENTNVFANMIEEFELDKSFKYPKLHDNSEDVFNKKIKEGFIAKKIEEKHNLKEYKDRIDHEFSIYKKQNAIDFMLLEEDVKSSMRKEGIHAGYSRGSVSGSLIAYLLGITDVDSIKYNLYFERFMGTRVSLPDIDSDWSPTDRDRVKEYLHKDMHKKYDNLYTAEIITFNTIALRGAIKDVAGGIRELSEEKLSKIKYPKSEIITLEEADAITKDIDNNEEKYRKKYPTMFKYVDMLMGTIVSVGSHPAATVISPVDLEENIGTFTLKTNKYPIIQLNMKEIDSLNFVKLDVLGLDNVGIINKACEMVGIDRLTPDNMNFEDNKVWDNMCKHPMGIFQFEGGFAHSVLKQILSKETINKIKIRNPDVKKINLMSMANGAIRPAGESYRDALVSGEFKDNGHIALNKLLKSTNSFIVYQEQIMQFLNQFCGYSLAEADIIRRGFSKKSGTEKFIPKIKEGFIETMQKDFDATQGEAERIIVDFLTVIEDASDYLFSLNHSEPYSMIGFATGYLRTYHPLEFMTAILQMNGDNLDKTSKVMDYMRMFTKIKLSPARFGKSKGDYSPDKSTNSIYKGIASVKNLNHVIGDELYSLREIKYKNFTELLIDLFEKTSINKTKILSLIRIDFFEEFGISKQLELIYNNFELFKKGKSKSISRDKAEKNNIPLNILPRFCRETPKTFTFENIIGFLEEMEEYIKCTVNNDFSIPEKIKFQEEYLGYINFASGKDEDRRKLLVLGIKPLLAKKTKRTWAYSLDVISLGSGRRVNVTIWSRIFDRKPIELYDAVFAKRMEENRGYWYLNNYNKIEI